MPVLSSNQWAVCHECHRVCSLLLVWFALPLIMLWINYDRVSMIFADWMPLSGLFLSVSLGYFVVHLSNNYQLEIFIHVWPSSYCSRTIFKWQLSMEREFRTKAACRTFVNKANGLPLWTIQFYFNLNKNFCIFRHREAISECKWRKQTETVWRPRALDWVIVPENANLEWIFQSSTKRKPLILKNI